jgi:hypothetical protein
MMARMASSSAAAQFDAEVQGRRRRCRSRWVSEGRVNQTLVFGGVGFVVIVVLVFRELGRRKIRAAPVVEAPVVQRRLIVTALVASLGLLFGAFAGMAASIEEWVPSLVLGAFCAAFFGSLWFTRKPLAAVRLDSDQLTSVVGAVTTRIALAEPFTITSKLKLPLLPRRGLPWMLVTVDQGPSSISFCFPWGFAQLGATPTQTSEPLPFLLLDWRGGEIFERLRSSHRP